MCDDAHDHLSRRSFLHGSAALAAGAVVLGRGTPQRPLRRLPQLSASRPLSSDGGAAYSMAMHIHSSFSEQSGSMDAQLYQATTNSVDVLWWTDHDHRMDGLGYRDTVHFTSLTHEKGGAHQGGVWTWEQRESGSLTGSSGGGIVTSPSSPNDPVSGGSMHLAAQSSSNGKTGKYGYYANSKPAGRNYRDNLTGQSLSIDVLLDQGWTNGYLELLIGTSYHEASGGRPNGLYSLSYQFVPSGQGSRTAHGNKGVIRFPVQPASPGDWTTITFTPSDDIAALWPDLDYRDFALWQLTLSAVSTGDAVSGYFDYLRFDRTVSGNAFLAQQADMTSALAAKYSSVAQHQGLEVSWILPHVNWYGGNVSVPSYQGITPGGYTEYVKGTVIPQAHSSGGLVAYNHPYGYTDNLLPQSQQDALLPQVASLLLSDGVLGCDLIEVGYERRGGADLAHHAGLWDVLSRNAVFLTGNGVSDDHLGTNWHGIANNWVTSAWAPSAGQADLLAALAAGRSWCGSLSEFTPSAGACLDLTVDGTCPMGSVSVSAVTSRQLVLTAAGVPAGGSVQVLQGVVDYAGTADPAPDTAMIASYAPGELGGNGQATQTLDTSADSFVRTQVLDATGTVIALSNPVWLLQNPPPGGIPPPRQA